MDLDALPGWVSGTLRGLASLILRSLVDGDF
jgi:hypothetical protein